MLLARDRNRSWGYHLKLKLDLAQVAKGGDALVQEAEVRVLQGGSLHNWPVLKAIGQMGACTTS